MTKDSIKEEDTCDVCRLPLGDVRGMSPSLNGARKFHPACSPSSIEEDWWFTLGYEREDGQTIFFPEMVEGIVKQAEKRKVQEILDLLESIRYDKKEKSVFECSFNVALENIKGKIMREKKQKTE